MSCAVCGKPCAVMDHHFYEGIGQASVKPGEPWRSVRQWAVTAPLYFASSPDRTACVAPFCSPKCSLEWTARQ